MLVDRPRLIGLLLVGMRDFVLVELLLLSSEQTCFRAPRVCDDVLVLAGVVLHAVTVDGEVRVLEVVAVLVEFLFGHQGSRYLRARGFHLLSRGDFSLRGIRRPKCLT